MNKRALGGIWEKHAAEFLKAKDFDILFLNWTCRWGEIDLIGLNKGVLVFVEVKYKSSLRYGSPWDAITPRKKKHQLNAIKIFLCKGGYSNCPSRFDVVGITKIRGKLQIQHFEAVPLR